MNMKHYQKPTTQVVHIQVATFIAESVTGTDGNTNIRFGGASSTEVAHGRGGGGWDDEE